MKRDTDNRGPEDFLAGLPDGEREALGRIWQIAESADPVGLSDEEVRAAFRKVEARLGHSATYARGLWRQMAGLAAALIIGVISGYLLANSWASRQGGHGPDETSEYLLLIRNDGYREATVSREILVEEFRLWAEELARDGRLVDAAELAGEGIVLQAGLDGLRIEDLSMSEDRATGYFVIRATNVEEAQSIAKSCPHIARGGGVELREIRK